MHDMTFFPFSIYISTHPFFWMKAFLRERTHQLKVVKVLAAEIAFVVVVVVVVLLAAHTYERRTLIVGILCIIFGTCMYAAPLSVMVRPHFSRLRSIRKLRLR